MAFVQERLVIATTQSVGVFNNYAYEPDNGDTSADLAVAGYFSQSRFIGQDGWIDGIITASLPDGVFLLQIGTSGTSATIVGGGGSSTPAGVLAGLGETLILSAADLDQFLMPASIEYPNGYYEMPDETGLVFSGMCTFTLPIVIPVSANVSISSVDKPPQSSFIQYIGSTGSGPVSYGEDAAFIVLGTLYVRDVSVADLVNGVAGLIVSGRINTSSSVFACRKAFSVYDGGGINSAGSNSLILQTSPSTVTITTGESASLDLSGFAWTNLGFVGNSDSVFDFTGAQDGTLKLTAVGIQSTNDLPDYSFNVADKATVKTSTFYACNEMGSCVYLFNPALIQAEQNTNILFRANSFTYGRPGGWVEINTPINQVNPGIGVYKKITQVDSSVALFQMSTGGTGYVDWDGPTIDDLFSSVSIILNIMQTTGVTAQNYQIGVFLDGSATPVFSTYVKTDGSTYPVTVNMPRIPWNNTLNSYIDIKIKCLTSGALDWTIDSMLLGVSVGAEH